MKLFVMWYCLTGLTYALIGGLVGRFDWSELLATCIGTFTFIVFLTYFKEWWRG